MRCRWCKRSLIWTDDAEWVLDGETWTHYNYRWCFDKDESVDRWRRFRRHEPMDPLMEFALEAADAL